MGIKKGRVVIKCRWHKRNGDEYRWPESLTDGGIDGIGVIRGLGGGVR